MKEHNLLEDLVAVSPGMEIWWDSSPVIFENWCTKMLAKADDGDKEILKRQFARMYDRTTPWASCSAASPPTRPSPCRRSRTTRRAGRRSPQGPRRRTTGSTRSRSSGCSTRKSSSRAPTCSCPLFEASGYKEGFLSGQVDPRSAFDEDAMLAQALEIHAVNPNVMVKVPGTEGGLRGHRGAHLARHRHEQHPHLRPAAAPRLRQDRVMRGLEKAKANGVDLSQVALGDHPHGGPLRRPRRPARGLRQGEGHRAHRGRRAPGRAGHLQEGLPHGQGARLPEQDALLLAAPRPDGRRQAAHLAPRGEGRRRHRRHLPAVPHRRGASTSRIAEDIKFEPNRIGVDPPEEVMDKLLPIPYFERAYDEDGYTRDEYNTHPALVKTPSSSARPPTTWSSSRAAASRATAAALTLSSTITRLTKGR